MSALAASSIRTYRLDAATVVRLVCLFCALAAFLATFGLPRWIAQRCGWRAGRGAPVLFQRLICAGLGVRVRRHGALNGGTNQLIVANHVSWLDIPVLGSLGPMSFLAKKEVGANLLGRELVAMQGVIYVDRRRRSCIPAVNARMAEAMRAGSPVVLFAEATTGDGALRRVQEMEDERKFVEGFFQASGEALRKKLLAERDEKKSLEKELARLKMKLAMGQGTDLAAQAVEVKGAKLLVATLDGADAKTLRETLDKLKDKLKSAAIVLASVEGGKVSLIAGVTPEASKKVEAGELVNFVAQQVGGKGGGRPDMAQAGGTEPANLPAALAGVKGWIEAQL